MKNWTFKEVYTNLGVKRQTAQGWVYNIFNKLEDEELTEKKNPSHYNKTEPWIFSDYEMRVMWQIRLLKQIKTSDEEIREIMNSQTFDIVNCFKESINEIKRQRDELDRLISMANQIIESEINPEIIRAILPKEITSNFEEFKSMLSVTGFGHIKDADNNEVDIVLEECFNIVWGKLDYYLDQMYLLKKDGIPFDSELVVDLITSLYNYLNSNIEFDKEYFKLILLGISDEKEIKDYLDKKYAVGFGKYLYNALYDFPINEDEQFLVYLADKIEKLYCLAKKNYPSSSKEIQDCIKHIHDRIKTWRILSWEQQLDYLRNLPNGFNHPKLLNENGETLLPKFKKYFEKSIQNYINTVMNKD